MTTLVTVPLPSRSRHFSSATRIGRYRGDDQGASVSTLHMTTQLDTRDAAVAAVLGRLSHLAMLPDVAVRVLALAGDPNVTMARMAEVISLSPELTARILRIVNSAFYGFPGQIRSIERATVLMGLQSVKNVTIAASLTRAFLGRPVSTTFSPRDLWTHSLAVAAASRLVALDMNRGLAEEAFLAGLMHDIGLTAALQVDRQKIAAVLAQLEADPTADILQVEERVLGATHQDLGAALLRGWNLPAVFSQVAASHHAPFGLPDARRTLPMIVYVGDRIAAALEPPFVLDDRASGIPDEALDDLRLTRAQVEAILPALPSAVSELHAALS